MGIIDTVIIVLFLIFMIIGFFRGFIKQVLSSFAWVFAMVAGVLLCTMTADAIFETSVGAKLYEVIFNWISGKGELFTTVIPSMTEEYFVDVLSNLGIPSFLHKFLIDIVDVSVFKDTSIAAFISPKICDVLLIIVSFLIIYLFVFIMIKVICSICSHIVRGSALGFIDGVLGMLWGAVKITVLLSILMLGLSFVVTMPFGEAINEWITADMRLAEEGFGVAKFFYENNPILYVISKLPFDF